MDGGVVDLQLPQEPTRLGRLEGVVEGAGEMGVQVVLHQADHLDLRVGLVDQPLDDLGIVLLGAPIGDGDVAIATKGLDTDEEVRRATADVLVVGASCVPGRTGSGGETSAWRVTGFSSRQTTGRAES
jgi:hypothetical protein